MADNRANAYWEGDTAVFRASSFGNPCLASLARSLAGQPEAPPPAFLLAKFEEGNRAEPLIINALRDHGWIAQSPDTLRLWGEVDGTDQLKLELTLGRSVVRCHPDGIVLRADVPTDVSVPAWASVGTYAVLEVKALGAALYDEMVRYGTSTKPAYDWQNAVEQLVTGLPIVYVVCRKDANGDVELDTLHVTYYDRPPVTKAAMLTKALAVIKEARAMDAGGGAPTCNEVAFPCPHYRNGGDCGQRAPKPDQPQLSERQLKTLNKLVNRAASCRDEKQVWADKETEARAHLLAFMVDNKQVSCTSDDGVAVTYRPPAPGSVSWKALALRLAKAAGLSVEALAVLEAKHRGKDTAPSVTVKEVKP